MNTLAQLVAAHEVSKWGARAPLEVRLLRRVIESPEGCWTWTGATAAQGYGNIGVGNDQKAWIHRVAYELWVGPIPDGFQIDHLCHSVADCTGPCAHRVCVNPRHLMAVLPRANNLRSGSPIGLNSRKTHCVRGHEFSAENTRVHYVKGRPNRQCRQCLLIREANRNRRTAGAA